MVIAVASSTLNANALYSVQKRFRSKRVHRIYLNNVFICNFCVGSIAYLSYMLIKFGSNRCWLRDVCFISTVAFTNINQLSMICILFCQLRKTVRIHVLHGTLKKISFTVHIIAVICSWVFSVVIIMILILRPNSVFSLAFTICKVICIIGLSFKAIQFIRKGINLQTRRSSQVSKNSDTDNTKTAMTIMTSFLLVTVVTWLPLIVMLSLQKFGTVSTKKMAPVLMIGVRIVCLGPLIDPLFYFWSKQTRKAATSRT